MIFIWIPLPVIAIICFSNTVLVEEQQPNFTGIMGMATIAPAYILKIPTTKMAHFRFVAELKMPMDVLIHFVSRLPLIAATLVS